MSTHSNETNTVKLMALLESVKPIFEDLGILIAGAKKLQSKYHHQLNYLYLYFQMEQKIVKGMPVTEKDLEHRVMSLCEVFTKLGEIMTQISSDEEERQLHLHAGTLEKLQEIAQRLSRVSGAVDV